MSVGARRPHGLGDSERCAARTDTDEYPRSASGRRPAPDESSPAAFHAARSRPNANQFREASPCCIQKAPGFLNRRAAGVAAAGLVAAGLAAADSRIDGGDWFVAHIDSSSLLRNDYRGQIGRRTRVEEGEVRANCGESWRRLFGGSAHRSGGGRSAMILP
jgi:hypothetical protein